LTWNSKYRDWQDQLWIKRASCSGHTVDCASSATFIWAEMEAELLVNELFVNTGIVDPNAGEDVAPKGWEDEDWTSPPAGEAWVFPNKLTLPTGDTVLKPGAGEDVPKPRAEGNTSCEIPDVDSPNADVEDPGFLLPTAGVEICPGEPVEPNTKAGDVFDCPEAEVEANSEGFVGATLLPGCCCCLTWDDLKPLPHVFFKDVPTTKGIQQTIQRMLILREYFSTLKTNTQGTTNSP
jgi:hypothetical protein